MQDNRYPRPWRVVSLSKKSADGNRWATGRANVVSADEQIVAEDIGLDEAETMVRQANSPTP